MNINKRSGNSEAREGVGKQVVGAAVNRFLRNKMSAVLTESLKDICNRGSARSSCKSCNAALKSGYSLFKNILGRIAESAVNVARIFKSETVGGLIAVIKNIRCGCINGNGAGIGGWVGVFLTYMKLESFKFIIRHNIYFLSMFSFYVSAPSGGSCHGVTEGVYHFLRSNIKNRSLSLY